MRLIALASIAVLLAACGSSREAREVAVPESGFLGDAYALLGPGDAKEGEPLLFYANPDAAWASYDRVIVDPVEVWGRAANDTDPGDMETLTNRLRTALIKELGQDVEVVEEAGPNTLRIGAALTDAQAANQTMTAVSSILPPAILLSNTYEYVTDEPSFQGQASGEFKVTDAATGELLAASIDRRIGGHTLESAESSWADVDNILAYWAGLARYRLCGLQERPDCKLPQTGGL